MGGCAGVGGGKRRVAACRVSCGLRTARNACGGGVRWGVRGMPRFAACRVSCGLWAARNACVGGVRGAWGACRVLQPVAFLAAFGPLATLAGWGALGRAVHAALCGIPRFLRPLGRSQCLRGWGALGRAVHAALCSMPRFLRPLGRSQRLRRAGCGGVGCMPRFATCRVSCGLRAARNACFFVLRHRDLGRCPKPRQGAQGSVCPVGTWAKGPKRPEAGQRNHERDRQGSAND